MYARVAQLVEHDLAKVGAAGSSPVSRSLQDIIQFYICASGSVGGARPCQGRGRGFESRLALFFILWEALIYRGSHFSFLIIFPLSSHHLSYRMCPLRSVYKCGQPYMYAYPSLLTPFSNSSNNEINLSISSL